MWFVVCRMESERVLLLDWGKVKEGDLEWWVMMIGVLG